MPSLNQEQYTALGLYMHTVLQRMWSGQKASFSCATTSLARSTTA
jgi:hypothetical protein